MDSEPILPSDLEREIFQVTGELYPTQIPTLLRVARRVLIWLEPMLYRVMLMETNDGVYDRFITCSKSKPPQFLAQSIRHVIVSGEYGNEEEFASALERCTGVTRFAALGSIVGLDVLRVLGTLKLQRLAGFLCSLFRDSQVIDPAHPIFVHITHLDLFDSIQEDAPVYIRERLPSLPALSHLSLNECVHWSILQALLERCQRLEVLVVLFQEAMSNADKHWVERTPIQDMRFVATFFQYWWEAVREARNYWTRAEEFIERKRRNEIDANCFWVE